MKLHLYIAIVLLAVLSSCQPHPTSPQPSPGGEGVASLMLENIDSLMWQQPDSALKVMLEFAGSERADSMDVFEGHYCQVLVAELLFKMLMLPYRWGDTGGGGCAQNTIKIKTFV